MTARRALDSFIGWHIEEAIKKAVKIAGTDGPVQVDFNGVILHIDADSDPALILRDWHRGLSGYITGPVGPHPAKELTAAELAHDAEVERGNEARRQEADRKWREKEARERAEHEAALASAPAMDRDEAKWQQGVDAQKGDGYGLGVYKFAEAWARLMQQGIGDGKSIADIADDCCTVADKGIGITGFMYGAAVAVLADCWKHGDDLRRWHNIKTQFGNEGERANESGGVLNPALMTIG